MQIVRTGRRDTRTCSVDVWENQRNQIPSSYRRHLNMENPVALRKTATKIKVILQTSVPPHYHPPPHPHPPQKKNYPENTKKLQTIPIQPTQQPNNPHYNPSKNHANQPSTKQLTLQPTKLKPATPIPQYRPKWPLCDQRICTLIWFLGACFITMSYYGGHSYYQHVSRRVWDQNIPQQ